MAERNTIMHFTVVRSTLKQTNVLTPSSCRPLVRVWLVKCTITVPTYANNNTNYALIPFSIYESNIQHILVLGAISL